MSRRIGEIVLFAGLLLGVSTLLDAVGFWPMFGLHAPHGYLVQGGLFLVIYFLLSTFLFDPYMRILDERDNQTVRKQAQTEVTRLGAEAMIKRYRGAIDAARLSAVRDRERRALEAEDEERKLASATKIEAGKSFEIAVQGIREESGLARKRLEGDTVNIANEIIARVLSAGETMRTVAAPALLK